ncbi:MAG: DUF2461 domain-containing protein [Candidatus Rokuibacteriota bacterium]
MSLAQEAITPRTFAFLRQLPENNNRPWFEANKHRYLREVRDPLLRFVAAFAPRLQKISPHMVADPRPVGGSLFRIYRDTRFSRDKSPYKAQAGMSFRHLEGRDVHGPVFYLHLEPGTVFSAAGMWRPPPEAVTQVRDAIVAGPGRWRRATRACPLSDHEGDRLKRVPRGYDPEHPNAQDLKRLSFTTATRFTQREACAPDFLDRFEEACRKATPLMEFLTDAVGLRW